MGLRFFNWLLNINAYKLFIRDSLKRFNLLKTFYFKCQLIVVWLKLLYFIIFSGVTHSKTIFSNQFNHVPCFLIPLFRVKWVHKFNILSLLRNDSQFNYNLLIVKCFQLLTLFVHNFLFPDKSNFVGLLLLLLLLWVYVFMNC